MFYATRWFVLMQLGYFIYSISGVFLKYSTVFSASSMKFYLFFGGAFFCLTLYAIIWQQVLRKFGLIWAYAWRGMAFIWTFFWAVLLFDEKITMNNVIGGGIIIAGMLMVAKSE